MKRLFVLILAVSILLCLGACKGDKAPTNPAADSTAASENVPNKETIFIPAETESSVIENENPVFNTEGIEAISLRADYGESEEHPVPDEHMEDITKWLGSFTVDRMIEKDEEISPGSNFYHVKIEYSDGTVVESGLSTTIIGEDSYYINSARVPECFWDILA